MHPAGDPGASLPVLAAKADQALEQTLALSERVAATLAEITEANKRHHAEFEARLEALDKRLADFEANKLDQADASGESRPADLNFFEQAWEAISSVASEPAAYIGAVCGAAAAIAAAALADLFGGSSSGT